MYPWPVERIEAIFFPFPSILTLSLMARVPVGARQRSWPMGFGKQFVIAIDANRTVKDELAGAIGKQRGRRRISVTDLLNTRQAFFRRTRPEIQPPPERIQAMLSGTGFHELFGKAVSTVEFREQFVEMDGIVGKIDIYEDVPTELKTTTFIPDDIVADRPGYIDQLGMYCTMTASATGRLIIYKRPGRVQPATLRAYDVVYSEPRAIKGEMHRRRDLLEEALATGSPSGLPACEWFESGCDYEKVCDCGKAQAWGPVVARAGVALTENHSLVESVGSRLQGGSAPPRGFRLNDLVFPRKAALERKPADVEEESPETDIERRLADLDRQGFYGALTEAIRFGVPGAFSRTVVELGTVTGWVSTYRGVPTILRATKLADLVDARRVPDVFGHYVDRLAIECALTGQERGRIVVYYQSMPDEKFMVYDVGFTRLKEIVVEAERRLALLEAGAPTRELPPCPAWMSRFCSFAPACGCARAEQQ